VVVGCHSGSELTAGGRELHESLGARGLERGDGAQCGEREPVAVRLLETEEALARPSRREDRGGDVEGRLHRDAHGGVAGSAVPAREGKRPLLVALEPLQRLRVERKRLPRRGCR
jgi:hypothetical protein